MINLLKLVNRTHMPLLALVTVMIFTLSGGIAETQARQSNGVNSEENNDVYSKLDSDIELTIPDFRDQVIPDRNQMPDEITPTLEAAINTHGQPADISSMDADPPYGGRAWDGNNPFHQPARTTNYYGSGDADNDGDIDGDDVSLAQDMVDGLTELNIRVDVDGDGDVDLADVSLIESARLGGTLPGWWNQLTSRLERESWVDKILALDKTNEHPYFDWWVCFNYSTQLTTNSAFFRGDLIHTRYDGGHTLYNIPMYIVGVYGHAINAVLIGDDPLDFDDWRFIEPQTDLDVTPGMWDMPYGTVKIEIPEEIYSVGHSVEMKVTFTVSSTGWTLDEYDPALVLHRPSPTLASPDNRTDSWNPRVVPKDTGVVLFERHRDDITRSVDIHVADLPITDPLNGELLNLSPHRSHLLDYTQGQDNAIHLLWKGKPDFIPGVFHGLLNLNTKDVTGVTRIISGIRKPLMGRLISLPGGEIHVFWLEGRSNASHPYLPGVYWTKWTGSAWQAIQNLTPDTYQYLYDYHSWGDHNAMLYFFDVAIRDGDIFLVWTEQQGIAMTETLLRYRIYDGVWNSPVTVETANVQGVDLAIDTDGILHLAYWLGNSSLYEEGRGILLHRNYNGFGWSTPQTLDGSEYAGYPQMAAGNDGEIYLVWERHISDQVVPVWNRFRHGVWSDPQTLDVRIAADAWYPTVDVMSDDSLLFTWSSRSDGIVTIESKGVKPVTAGFSGTPRSGIAPQLVSFTNTSTGDYTNSWWDLGDGWVTAMQHPSHQYGFDGVGGVYTVTLKVNGPGGTDIITASNYITIYTPVNASFGATPTSGVSPLTVNFVNTSSGDYSESLWVFGNGMSSIKENPTLQYTYPGFYTVTLNINGPGGSDSDTKTAYINVQHSILLPLILNYND